MPKDTLFYKVETTEMLEEEYELSKYPCMLLFKNGNYIDKVEGYFTTDEKSEFISKIMEIVK